MNITIDFSSPIIQIIARIGGAIIALLVGRWLAGRTRTWLRKNLPKWPVFTPSLVQLAALGAYYGIMFAAVLTALTLIGVPGDLVLGAGLVVLLVLGIALQQSISNLTATIIFMLFQPFRVGELVVANGIMGTVKEIQLFSTVLVTGDNTEVTIPNAQIQGNNLINYTRLGRLRIDFVFPVSYRADMSRVTRVLHELFAADPRILTDPAPAVFVLSLDNNGMNLAVRPWTTPGDYWQFQFDFVQQVKLRFDDEGITFPFSQYDVHLYRAPGAANAPVAGLPKSVD